MPRHVVGHHNNNWIAIDDSSDPDFFVRFLDATRVRAIDFAKSNPKAAFAHLALSDGQKILDCGCGTGDMLRLIARQIGDGSAVGIELSQLMIDEAGKRSNDGPSNLRFEKMDSQSLSFPDEEFDRVMATQLLVHVTEPKKAFDEMCRVVASGGIVAVTDIDWDSLTLGCSDVELGRRFVKLFSDGIRNGTIVREYAGWFAAAGFSNVRTIPQPLLMDQLDGLKQFMVEPSLEQFVENGSMSQVETEKLLTDLLVRDKAGSTFSGATFYTVVAEKN